jgi:arylsulfatase A-like enzyme
MRPLIRRTALLGALFFTPLAFAAGQAEHVVVVVWDGMRAGCISREHTPALYQLSREGVLFQNHHAEYCSATEVNGAAIATGVHPEHSGIIANREYRPEIEPLKTVGAEAIAVVRKGDQMTGGRYLLRPTLVETLQAAGKSTVIAGTKPVALLHDRRERPDDTSTDVVLFAGNTLPPSALAPICGLLGDFPAGSGYESTAPNEPRDEWTTRALLGPLWSNGVPAFTLLWLSEPDASQHAAGLGSSRAQAALQSSDRKLAAVLAELDRRGLRDQTDILVAADHGFSTVENSVDVCKALRDAGFSAYREFKEPPKRGDILVVGQGGSVLFYIIKHDARTTRKLVTFLQQQEFTGVILTRKPMRGAFMLAEANINSPRAPDVVLSLRWSGRKNELGVPGVLVSDGNLRPGEGSHASLSRFDLHNMLVAAGPDLKNGFADTLPTGNIDLAPTVLWLFGLEPKEPMDGRVLSEALTIDAPPAGEPTTRKLETECAHGKSVWHQYLQISRVNRTIYLDEGNGYVTRK